MSKYWIWLAAGATLLAVYLVPGPESDSISLPTKSAAVPPAASPQAASPQAPHLQVAQQSSAPAVGQPDLRIRPRDGQEDWGNLFGSAPPPPSLNAPVNLPKTKIKPAPPLPPQAPPLPFQYMGRMADGKRVAYFLQWNQRNLVLHPGETVDKIWKLEQAHGGVLTFTYLPLNQKQSLAVGDVN